ncbi:MAG: MFS transporter, partial [Actinomycetes bacterium]
MPETQLPDPRRWRALAFIALAQLMVVLDATIVNIALPSAQADLGISDANRQWVITAYALAFGSLLLLGGRIADMWGRKNTFLTGLIGFAAASALGGAAVNEALMFASRALQGAFGALLAPAALSLLAVMFTDGKERAKAFGIFGAIAGGGAALGLILGGILTEYLDWRWVLFVNVPIGALIALATPRYIRESERHPGHFDLFGALASTLGMVLLVYGFIRASEKGWSNPLTVAAFVGAVVFLALFLTVERRSKQPITPLKMFRDRNRAGAYAMMLCLAAAMFGMFFFLTLFVQDVLGYSPLRSGLALLPLTVGVLGGATLAQQSIKRLGIRSTGVAGLIVGAAGALL